MDLISINDAAERGIVYLRQPQWANPLSHLKIDIQPDGKPGIWLRFFDPFNKECNGRDPVEMLAPLAGSSSEKCWLPYTGKLSDSDEYKAAVKNYEGSLA